jgi:BNR-Asp box repeat
MDTLLIGYSDGLVRASANGAGSTWVMKGAPIPQVAVDPGRPECLYAATLGQGLWRSDDRGESFERLPGFEPELAWSVAVSASDRNADGYGAIYVGTQMSAVYRSDDGGESFAELSSIQDLPSKPQWAFPPAPNTHHVHQITLDIDDPDTIVFGVELGGVYRSSDRGATWVRTEADPDPHTLRTHPSEPARMYEGGGAFPCLSRDGGATWERLLDGLPDEVRYFYSLAVDSGAADNVIVSAARDPFSGHAVPIEGFPTWSSLYRLVDSTWQEITAGLPDPNTTAMGTLAAGGPGFFYYVTEPGEVYISTDGGLSFEQTAYDREDPGGQGARCVLVLNN